MAKPVKAATTRIAATLTARYVSASGATDAFFMDGRMNSRREQRAADLTLDREDRGFFYAAFAHAGPASAVEGTTRVSRALEQMLQNMKQSGRNIDAEINELADTAVEVSGRITLQSESVRQPYFAGVIVRDSEMAAITMGSGCAYLYRNGVLYPLTTDDYPLEPIDQDGNPVDRINIYCAGVAGTVRYSNIAQLQVDDCVIICNRELMETVGQHEMLRLLDEAEDQCDAAGTIMTTASAKLPNASLQLLIGFVEAIAPVEKPVRSSGRQSVASPASGTLGGFGASPAAGSLATPLAQKPPQRPLDAAAAPAATASGSEPRAARSGAPTDEPLIFLSGKSTDVLKGDGTGALEMDALPAAPRAGHSRVQAARSTPGRSSEPTASPLDDDESYDEFEGESRIRQFAFYTIIALVTIGCLFAIYSMLFKKTGTSAATTRATTVATTVGTTAGITPGATSTSASTSAVTSGTSAASATTSGTQPGGVALPAKHTVKSGDTLSSIAKKYYNASTPELWQLIRDANSMSGDGLQLGQVLTIPAKS